MKHHLIRFSVVFYFLLFTVLLFSQNQEKYFYLEIKLRIAETSSNNDHNLFGIINSKLIRVESKKMLGAQISFNFQRSIKNTFGINLDFNSFGENLYYQTDTPISNVIKFPSNHHFIGAGLFYKYSFYKKNKSKFSIIPSLAVDVDAKREVSYFLKIAGELSLQYKLHIKDKKHCIINIYHRSALKSYSSNEGYFPFANGISLGFQF